MTTNGLFVMVALSILVGCTSGEPASVPTPVESTIVLQKEAEKAKADQPTKARMQKAVLIGGCQQACEDYKQSFRSYLSAAFRGESGQHTIPFLETSEMIHNGKKRGSEWVELWRAGNLEQRKDEIAAFAKEVHGWVELSNSDDLEVSLVNQVTFSEDDGPGFLAFYKPPSRVVGDSELKEWRFRIQKRGWEWLISEMTTRSPGP